MGGSEGGRGKAEAIKVKCGGKHDLWKGTDPRKELDKTNSNSLMTTF